MRRQLTPQQWRAVELLFHAAVESPPEARDALLREHSALQPEVAGVVRELLAAEADPMRLDAGIEALVRALLE